MNKLARALTKWTKSCDKGLAGLISYIYFDFARDLEDSKSTSGGILCIFGRHTFVPRSWMCKKQTSVSHSSTEAEIFFLDTGSRMDCIPALTFWDLVIEVFQSVPNRTDEPKREPPGTRRQLSSQTCITPSQSSTPTPFQQTLITFHQIQRILVTELGCLSLRTMRQSLR